MPSIEKTLPPTFLLTHTLHYSFCGSMNLARYKNVKIEKVSFYNKMMNSETNAD